MLGTIYYWHFSRIGTSATSKELQMTKFPTVILRRFRRIKKILGTDQIYFVGGCVRDALLGRNPSDYDLTTVLSSDIVEAKLKEALPSCKVLCTNREFGTVRVIFKDSNIFEITTYRTEGPYSDFRHPDWTKRSTSLKMDLQRRDFTINAIAYDGKKLIGEIVGNYHTGNTALEDLEKRILSWVGSPEQRIKEDPIRLLRAARFMGELDLAPAAYIPSMEATIRRYAFLLLNLPPERIRQELDKIFSSSKCHRILQVMDNFGLLSVIFPDICACRYVDQNRHHGGADVFDHIMKCMEGISRLETLNDLGQVPYLDHLFIEADKDIKLAVLFHDTGKPRSRRWEPSDKDFTFHGHEDISARIARNWMVRMHYSNERTGRVVTLIRNHMFSYPPKASDKAVRRLLCKFEADHCSLDDLLRVRIADRYGNAMKKGSVPRYYPGLLERIERIQSESAALKVADMEVSGHDVMNIFSLGQGRYIGRILSTLFETLIDCEIPNRRKTLMTILRATAKQYPDKLALDSAMEDGTFRLVIGDSLHEEKEKDQEDEEEGRDKDQEENREEVTRQERHTSTRTSPKKATVKKKNKRRPRRGKRESTQV